MLIAFVSIPQWFGDTCMYTAPTSTPLLILLNLEMISLYRFALIPCQSVNKSDRGPKSSK